VPEPSALMLIGCGVASIAIARRMRLGNGRVAAN
jgi:hypothetical protein